MGLPLGEKGLFQVARPAEHRIPSSERIDYITHVLEQMWRVYDPILCRW